MTATQCGRVAAWLVILAIMSASDDCDNQSRVSFAELYFYKTANQIAGRDRLRG
jgi:hypothetical protein